MPTILRIKKNYSHNVCSGTKGPIECGILYMHSMASPRINEDFGRHLEPFVGLCHARGHRPISALLVSTLWPNAGETEVYQRTENLEGHFKRTATPSIYRIPCSVRFDGSRSSACDAIDVLMSDMQYRENYYQSYR